MIGRKLQVALLAGVLILANAQCLFACATEPCDPPSSRLSTGDPVPPCHRQQHQSKQSDAPPPCAHAPLLAEYRAPVDVEAKLTLIAIGLADVALLHSVSLSNPVGAKATVFPEAVSPPPSPALALSTVLKV